MEQTTDKYGRLIKEQIPYPGIRKIIGTRMRQSLDVAPQGTCMSRADMSKLLELRTELKKEGKSVTFLDLFVKSVACALKMLPIANSSRDDDFIYVYETMNIAIAVNVDNNSVIAPVIRNAQDMSLLEIAEETRDLIEKARNKDFAHIPMDGATITVNNLGMYDVDGCTPFINLPEAMMVTFGATRPTAWVDDDNQIVVRPVTTISITNDHTITDGGQTAQFAGAIKTVMKDPRTYLL